MSERRRFLGELSWFQVVAGALAAMTSAWIASALGVAGTIIGAAIGSLVVTITSAFYARTLDKSRVLVVRTEQGTTIERAIEPGDTEIALAEIGASTDVKDADVEDVPQRLHWKTIGVTSLAVLVLAFGGMGVYELATGDSYGVSRDNAKIGNPLGGGSSRAEQKDEPAAEESTPTPTESATEPTPEPTETTPEPTETTPAPTEATPTPSPTETAPAG